MKSNRNQNWTVVIAMVGFWWFLFDYFYSLCLQNKVTSVTFLCGKALEDLCRVKQVCGYFSVLAEILFHYRLTYFRCCNDSFRSNWLEAMCPSFQGRPWFTSHGLGDQWASGRGLSRNQSWTERPREHPQGSSGESPWMERWWKH